MREKEAEAANRVKTGAKLFPETRARASLGKYLSKHNYRERDLTGSRRSSKLTFEA